MNIEKEVRYSVTEEVRQEIIKNTTTYKDKKEMLDITCGYDGFESYLKNGYICRVRQKGDKKTLEVKNYLNEKECIEQEIVLDKISDGVNYLKLIGMQPYLYLKRDREVRKYKGLKVFIDEFDILGNFVEIEYQNSENAEQELLEFIDLVGIVGEPQDMYGAIVKTRLATDKEFEKVFNENLEKILGNY